MFSVLISVRVGDSQTQDGVHSVLPRSSLGYNGCAIFGARLQGAIRSPVSVVSKRGYLTNHHLYTEARGGFFFLNATLDRLSFDFGASPHGGVNNLSIAPASHALIFVCFADPLCSSAAAKPALQVQPNMIISLTGNAAVNQTLVSSVYYEENMSPPAAGCCFVARKGK